MARVIFRMGALPHLWEENKIADAGSGTGRGGGRGPMPL